MNINKEEISFKEIEINIKNPANNVEITVTKLDEKPSATENPKNKVYQYLEIKKENIEDKAINNAVINFKIEKSWLNTNNADEDAVALSRYTTSWQELKTEKTDSDNNFIHYKAETPSFSFFAVTAEEKIQEIENITTEETEEAEEEAVEEEQISEEEPKRNYIWLIAISVVFVIAGFWYYRNKNGK